MVTLLLALGCVNKAEHVEYVDFSLEDMNPTSATFGAMVSPRDYEGQVSVWYFGHAT